MLYAVEILQVPEQLIAAVRGPATMATLPANIRALFDQFYAGFQGKAGLNIVYYPGGVCGEFEISCGVLVADGGTGSLPGGAVATTVYMGPYDQMKPAHEAIHRWVRENGRKIAGPSWEVYGHWNEDPAKLRTDIYYLLA